VTIVGGDRADVLTIDASLIPAGLQVSFDGGAGVDTVSGPSSDAGWTISGPGAGSVGSVTFSHVVAMASGDVGFLATMLSVLLMLNVMLGTFNLLPLPPLDGGAVFSIFLPENLGRQVREFQRNGALSMIGLVVAWKIFPLLSDPLFALVLTLVHPGTSYE